MSFDFSLPDICIHGSTVFARKPAELGLKKLKIITLKYY